MSFFDWVSDKISDALEIENPILRAGVGLATRLVATTAVSSLIGNRASQNKPSGSPPAGSQSVRATTGNRVQLSASTNNKISVLYGSAWVSPALTDAKISTDQQVTWYVMTLAEATDSGVYTMGNIDSPTTTDIYWGDKQLIFGDGGNRSKVTKWINGNGDEDTKVNGFMNVYLFPSGSYSGVNTGGLSAIQIMSDPSIPAEQRWNGSRYSTGINTPNMYKTAFAIVKLTYNQDAGIIGLDQFKMKLTNDLTKPGSVILDYFTNTRYGCAVPEEQIDLAALIELDNYSDELITYTPVGGGSATQPRYRINGPIDTGTNCLTNLQFMVDSCDSWLQWNEALAKWSVIPNRSYLDYTTYDDLFQINSNNIVSGITISPVDLNSTYNTMEVQFPNTKIRDERDFVFVTLDEEDENPNEPVNKLIIELPIVSSSVQAKYLATRRLIQSREDLVATFEMDYSGIQINAGDVVRIRHEAYGWGPTDVDPLALDKLFRVDQVQEEKKSDGTLGVRISAFEYNNQVYENIDISDYDPAENTGLSDPTIVATPAAPTITDINEESGTFTVQAIVPSPGQVIAMEFWYGPTPTIVDNNYLLWDTQLNSTTPVYPAGTVESTGVVGFQPGDYYWAVRALTQTTKSSFSNSTSQAWSPAQPASRTVCESLPSAAISFSNLYKLWANDSRGTVLNCDYTPVQTGSDAGGQPTSQIDLAMGITNYTAGTSTGLVAEIWQATDSWSYPIQAMAYGGPAGFVFATGTELHSTGNIQGEDSVNPITYEQFVDQSTEVVNGIVYGGGKYVAVCNNGLIYYSTTGYDGWTAATVPGSASSHTFWAVAHNGTTFVAVGGTFSPVGAGTTYICSSTDGITWTQRNSTAPNELYCVAWNGSYFTALGAGFTQAISSDGITWTVSSVAGGSSYSINGVTYNSTSGLWIAVGRTGSNSVILTSPTTVTWTLRYTGFAIGEFLGVATNTASFNHTVAAGSKSELVTSNDGGLSWVDSGLTGTHTWYTVQNLNGAFYVMGDGSVTNYIAPIASSLAFDIINIWETFRIFTYGASPSSAYDLTIQPIQDQMPNNIPFNYTFRTGSYLAGVPLKYLLVAGNLNNPATPSTTYSTRKSIAITEFRG